MSVVEVVFVALNQLIAQLVGILPKLVIALLIWYVGKYFLTLGINLLERVDIKQTKIDEKAIATLSMLLNVIGRVVLVMVILDYLGIGSSIVAAIAQGVTFAVAIALGLSFGKALEGDAREVIESIKKFLKK
ncbi:hypothetical protein A2801_03570 [Candidatus Woesebacteria bacterium RIFCSPHIGHO2_01_FULL_41_10]|uniref:Uncharacterized protein n=1 Tax=Candidatus Woesebacteria bacterium RIFCSPHIGHO2_01_FULL_41_10 TaxID=1802500 RepID=A0A1F7YN46_9BACT|nr:MAG: hypothetical protein A2801_03570 [Candidatus Woesebacteria bacterium RIFCSPHIGHO2_01_FULL_41_10]